MQNFGSGVRACYGTFYLYLAPFFPGKLALLLLPLIPPSRQEIGISKFTHHLRVDCVEFHFGSSS